MLDALRKCDINTQIFEDGLANNSNQAQAKVQPGQLQPRARANACCSYAC